MNCQIPDCQNPHLARGLCATHYSRWRIHGHTKQTRPTLRERLFSRLIIDPETGCLNWTGGTNQGYGNISILGHRSLVHRVMYEMFAGPIPEGLVLDHLCRNPGCANVAHLEAVRQRENLMRGVGIAPINAAKTHCPKGHPYDDENTFHGRQSDGGPCRWCKTCRRERDRLQRQRTKVQQP